MLRENSKELYIPDNYNEQAKKKMLLFVPDLSLNGAQTVMFELLLILGKKYAVTLISSEDGEYRKKYMEIGVRISIRPYVACSEEFKRYMRKEYDLIFLNTSSTIPYIYFFINTDSKVLLWLHESEEQLKNESRLFPAPQLLSPNITVCGVTERVRRGIKNIFGCEISRLHMPIREVNQRNEKKDDKVRFFIPAAYTYIKGQDILLETIAKLPKEYINKSEFIFCGYCLDGQAEYYDHIKKIGGMLDNVIMLGALDREEVYKYYAECDCVVAPSRIDSTPTSIIEGMMFKKLVIVSSGAGISEYITDCVNGFVYNNSEELFQRLLLVINDCHNLSKVYEKAYELYTDNFSQNAVERELNNLIDGNQAV